MRTLTRMLELTLFTSKYKRKGCEKSTEHLLPLNNSSKKNDTTTSFCHFFFFFFLAVETER